MNAHSLMLCGGLLLVGGSALMGLNVGTRDQVAATLVGITTGIAGALLVWIGVASL